MIIEKKKFIFLVLVFFFKILGGFFYFFYQNEYGFDFNSIFSSYCQNPLNFTFEAYSKNILDFFHRIIFIRFCFLGNVLYYWFFLAIQSILIVIVFYKFYDFFKYKFNSTLLLMAIFLSPTFVIYASAPTKDGWFILGLCLIIAFSNRLPKLVLLIPALIKPYFLPLYGFKLRYTNFILFICFFSVFFYFEFYKPIIRIIEIKLSVFNFENLFDLNLPSSIFLFEILAIFFITFYTKLIDKKTLTFISLISLIGAGFNLNVGSRILTAGIFFLISVIYVKNK